VAWSWTLNWDAITPAIFIGSCPMAAADIDRIRAGTGASAMLSLQHDACLAEFGIDFDAHARRCHELGIVLRRYPIRDFDPQDMRLRLPGAVAALTGLLADGHRVYVHCTAGIGRSALAVLGYLTFVEGRSPDQAMGLIRGRRGCVWPNWEAYYGCRDDLIRCHREAIAERAYAYYQAGVDGDPVRDWRRAEAEVLREAVLDEQPQAP
jgi:hypothetical protein